MLLTPIDEHEVISIIKNLRNSRARDIYGFSTHLVKQLCNVISKPMCSVINNSFLTGNFPEELKISRITPIYKKGDKNEAGNYRPISVLPPFAKIYEKAICVRLEAFFEREKILTDSQYGFRKNKSTTHAIEKATTLILEDLEKGIHTQAILCDLSKAFDTICHKRLVEKLEHYGVRGAPLKIITSYLHNRRQIVTLGERASTLQSVSTGCPQGGILSACLFNIYVNDLPDNIGPDVTTIQFCDDTTFLRRCNNPTEKEDIERQANKWFQTNQLVSNQDKTQTIIFKAKLAEKKVDKESVKLLGFHIDETLRWDIHIDHLCKKMASAVFSIRRMRQVADEKTAKIVFHAMLQSNIQYGILVWGSSALANRVFLMQKRAVRAITGASPQTSCRPLFRRLGILTAPSVFILECLKNVLTRRDGLPTNADMHPHNTRTKYQLHTPRVQLSMAQSGSRYWGFRIYNRLPRHIHNMVPSKIVKVVRNKLLERAFYSIEEFMTATDFV